MRARSLLAGVICVAALVVGGCGEDNSSEVDEALSDLEQASGGDDKTSTQTGPSPGEPKDARAIVRDYFELIDAGEFSEAWSFLDPDVQSQFGGYESWRDGYGATTSTEVTDVDVTSTAGGETDLTVRIEAVALCDGERYEQDFEGPFSVDASREKITAAEFALISGSSPPSDC